MTYDTRAPGRIGALGYALMFAAAVALAVLVLNQFAALLDRPEVRVSYATGKCVEVVDHKALAEGRESKWSCDRLPESYEHVWVY
jgi:hypothetical protein